MKMMNKMKKTYHKLRNSTPLMKRYFKITDVKKNSTSMGVKLTKPVSGRTPVSAAKKAMTKLCKKSNVPCDKNKQTLTIILREQIKKTLANGGRRFVNKQVINNNKPKLVQYKYDIHRKKQSKKEGTVNHDNKNVYYKYKLSVKSGAGRKLINP